MSVYATPSPPYPLHESVVDRLDPEYIDFYNKYIINQQPVHYQPVSASRTSGVLIPGAREKLPVGSIEDYSISRTVTNGPNVAVRVYTPTSEPPESGYPVLLYFHGGGWVLGDISTEANVCTRFCETAKCVVISVDYRLAPENIWPAAVHDSWEALRWLKAEGAALLNLDLKKVAVGGSSAGGNLAAIMTHKALAEPEAVPAIRFQVLIVPVTDNTANAENQASYKENEHTAALPSIKMLWYRRHYLPNPESWSDPEASPLFYAEENFAKVPPAFIGVAELDVLRSEGVAYAERMERNGVAVQLKVYKGVPHPFMAMDGVLTQGKKLVNDMTIALANAFQSA